MRSRNKHSNKFRKDPMFRDLQGYLPWLDSFGKPLPPAVFASVSSRWDQETWDAFLESFEEPAQEKYVSRKRWEMLTEALEDSIFDLYVPSHDITEHHVDSSVQILPQLHRQVIFLTYWKNLSVRKIASALGLSKSLVQRMQKDAERTLRALIGGGLGQFASYEGTKKSKKERSDDQDISA